LTLSIAFPLQIVKALISDLRAILELRHLAFQSEAILLNDYTIQPLTQTLNEVKEEYAKGLILKAISDAETIIGSVWAYEENNTAYIGKLVVHPSFRNQGLGAKLLAAIEESCPARRYELHTTDRSLNNLHLYQKLGYQKFRTEPWPQGYSFVYLEKFS
jgi:ribosomal protein S18 acetylase RimI-like enzyme